MPSSDIVEDETAPMPKKSTTPRRSPAVRRPANATPTRKAAANKTVTPKSAPARTKPSMKKTEPTLFTDFMRGRPSVNRARRKSLDVVPMEMKRSAVGKVQPPGGVKERVKKWQKANAAAVAEATLEPPSEPDDISLNLDDESVTERDRRRIKFRKNYTRKPGRRKSGDIDNPTPPLKSVSSPRKRVVSDDHWVMKKEKKSPPRTPRVVEEPISKGQTLPKDFLKNSVNPPLGKKIEDWNKRIISDERVRKEKQTRNISNTVFKEVEQKSSPRSESPDRGIRVKPVKEWLSADTDIKKPLQSPERRKERQQDADDNQIPKRGSEKRKELPPIAKELPQGRRTNAVVVEAEEESNASCRTPTHPPRNKNRQRKSVSPESLADIPVGYSAFSVLDMSLGGDATTTKPPKPQRQSSLSAVPKVLKKVYTEGMKKVHDAVDPPRIGVNQPLSIESWLKGMGDPFVDDVPASEKVFQIAKPKSKQRSSEKETAYQKQNHHKDDDPGVNILEPPHNSIEPTCGYVDETASTRQIAECRMNEGILGEKIVNESIVQPISQTESKRSPAARHISPPKTARPNPPNIVADSIDEQPKSIPIGRSLNQSSKGSELSYEIRKETEAMRSDLEDRDREPESNTQGSHSPRSPQKLDSSYLNARDVPDLNLYKASDQRVRKATGQHRLSTIASVETFNTSSSLTETSSYLSDTTVTQTTITQNTSSTSNTSNGSYAGDQNYNQRNKNLGLKRRLTKHSDLLSALSLPDTSAPGRTKSIKSARSIRTTRTRLETATMTDLLRELADDEIKYMRELKTLVDGVIPVLLSCVLSKSDSAITAGLFSQNSSRQVDASITKPIVDMGIALEQLKTFHKRIPLHDTQLLIHWASSTHKVYEDYVDAWRMGFQNVIVNLAPASKSNSVEDQSLDEMPRNEDGDVLNENGERVDVAFLLKRPLARVKYLAKVMKGIHKIKPREQAARVTDQYEALLTKIRRRTREEEARLEDQAASSTDASRARDPRTLSPLEDVTIDPTRQVYAKDFFDFGLSHSSGQRVDCRVELLFRDKPQDKTDVGDVLICEIDSVSRWLLFPPIELDHISARAGDSAGELVVMIRGTNNFKSWNELFTLKSPDEETAAEWVQMLGLCPKPPNLWPMKDASIPTLSSLALLESNKNLSKGTNSLRSISTLVSSESDVPIGERRGKHEQLHLSKTENEEQMPTAKITQVSSRYSNHSRGHDTSLSDDKPRDLNEAMERAGRVVGSGLRRTKAKRYNSHDIPQSPVTPLWEKSATGNDANTQYRSKPASSPIYKSNSSPEDLSWTNARLQPTKLPAAGTPPIPEHRTPPQESAGRDTVLPSNDSIGAKDPYKIENTLSPAKQVLEEQDKPPLPPPHKTSNPLLIKSSPVLAKPKPPVKSCHSSSPLKREYQPSSNSDVSSASEESDLGDSGESSDSSEEELEAVDLAAPPLDPRRSRNRLSPPTSFYSLPSVSLAPSNSASQVAQQGDRLQSKVNTTKVVATISCWSEKGLWVDLHPQDCSVVVGPGLIEAYSMTGCLGSESGLSDVITDKDAGTTRPLVSLELTPVVPLRQSNALDIEIRSPPTAKSSVKCTHTVRFRSRTLQECSTLYGAIHRARMENPVYMKLEQERIVNAYGRQLLEDTAGNNRRRSWFGRSKSYRASARAPSDTVSDNSSNSIASAISRLRSSGVFGAFNIDKSSIATSQSGPSGTSSGATSVYTGSTNSTSSGITTPQSPSSPSVAMTGTSNVISFGSSNLKIRLYLNVTPSKWNDFGGAFLTVTHPPRGMRQASSLYHGVEKRIIVTKKQGIKQTLAKKIHGSGSPKSEEPGAADVILDVVLGGACFSRQGVVGIVMNVWEDIRGDNGEVGKVAAIGGVSGRTRRWMFHFASAAETAWAFSLVGGGVR